MYSSKPKNPLTHHSLMKSEIFYYELNTFTICTQVISAPPKPQLHNLLHRVVKRFRTWRGQRRFHLPRRFDEANRAGLLARQGCCWKGSWWWGRARLSPCFQRLHTILSTATLGHGWEGETAQKQLVQVKVCKLIISVFFNKYPRVLILK